MWCRVVSLALFALLSDRQEQPQCDGNCGDQRVEPLSASVAAEVCETTREGGLFTNEWQTVCVTTALDWCKSRLTVGFLIGSSFRTTSISGGKQTHLFWSYRYQQTVACGESSQLLCTHNSTPSRGILLRCHLCWFEHVHKNEVRPETLMKYTSSWMYRDSSFY